MRRLMAHLTTSWAVVGLSTRVAVAAVTRVMTGAGPQVEGMQCGGTNTAAGNATAPMNPAADSPTLGWRTDGSHDLINAQRSHVSNLHLRSMMAK